MHVTLHSIQEGVTASMLDLTKALHKHILNGPPVPQTHQVTQHVSMALTELQAVNRKVSALLLDLEEQHQQSAYEDDQAQTAHENGIQDPCIFSNPNDAKVVEDVR